MAEWIALGAIAGGTTLSAINQARAGKEARELHKQRAAAALKDAQAVRESLGEQARSKRKEGKRAKARQRVLFAKFGVKGPTALDIMKITADEFEREAGFIQETGVTESGRLTTQAKFERVAGRSAYRAGIFGAGATALSGIGTIGLAGAQRGLFGRTNIPGTPLRTGADLRRRAFLSTGRP